MSDIVTTPEMHGAKRDGVTDDTAAFDAAIALLGHEGGTLRLGEGTYRVAKGLVIPSSRHCISIQGRCGPDGEILSHLIVDARNVEDGTETTR